MDIKLSSAEKDEYLELISNVFNREISVFSAKYDRQAEGYNYLAGDQYTSAEKAYYDKLKRPTNTFNMLFDKFNHVLGDHYLSYRQPKVFPKPGGDQKTAEIWEDYLLHTYVNNDMKKEVGRTVLDGWIQMGYLYPRWSNEREIDGSTVVTNVDPFEIMFDSRARDYFLDDAMYIIRSRWMTFKDILNYHGWEHHRSKLLQIYKDYKNDAYLFAQDEWAQDNATNPHFSDMKNGKFRVVEFHQMDYEKAEVGIDPITGTADIITIKDAKRKALYIKSRNLKVVETTEKMKKLITIVPGLNFVLESRYADVQDGRPDIIPYWPFPFAQKAINFFGMMKNAKGPQDYINDAQNRKLDIINKAANVGAEIVADAYDNPGDAIYFGSRPGITLRKKSEFLGKETFKKFNQPAFPFTQDALTKEGLQFLEDITGVKPNLAGGSETKNENASLFAQRVAQAQIRFAVPTFMLRSVERRMYNKIIKIAQSNLTGERLLPVFNPQKMEMRHIYVNLKTADGILNDLSAGEYEVLADTGEKNPIAKAVNFAKKMEAVQFIANLFGPLASQAIDFEWLFADADMGDVAPMIQKLIAVQGQQAAAQQDQNALQNLQTAHGLASAQMSLENQAGYPGNAGPANLNRVKTKNNLQ